MPRRRGNSAGLFFGGLLTGLLVSAIVLVLALSALVSNPAKIAGLAQRFGLVQTVEKTVVRTVSKTIHAIPKQQVAARQDRINNTVQNLTDAYAEGRLTFEDVETLSDRVYQVIADQKVTEQEIDGLLGLAENLAR